MKLSAALLIALLWGTAIARQDPDEVKHVVEQYLQTQTRGLPGEVSFVVGNVAPHNKLPPCPALEAFMNPGTRPWGRTSVGVRCPVQGSSWTLYVPVQVKVVADYVVTARGLTRGEVIDAADLTTRKGDLARLPAGVLTNSAEALGKVLRVSLGSGQIVRSDALRPDHVVRQGQTVKVMSTGTGFRVATEGRALNSAAEGQVVQVRTGSGQTLSGVARAGGVVEITF